MQTKQCTQAQVYFNELRCLLFVVYFSEEASKIAARRIARILQKMDFRVRFSNFRVVNVLGTCSFPFGIRITHFSRDHPQNAR